MLLHIVNKSPLAHHTLEECLTYAASGSSILLIEDGVYATLENTHVSHLIKNALAKNIRIYVLEADIQARGLHTLIAGVNKIDYTGFVRLTTEHSHTQSWF